MYARPVVAIIFSFYGFADEVYELMQTTSHTTRAYIHAADGLKGFLIPSISTLLKQASQTKEWDKITEFQEVRIEAVIEMLS